MGRTREITAEERDRGEGGEVQRPETEPNPVRSVIRGASGTDTKPLGTLPSEKVPDRESSGSSVEQFDPDPTREAGTNTGGSVNSIYIKTMPGLFRDVAPPSGKRVAERILVQR